jgi:hypothetical protein
MAQKTNGTGVNGRERWKQMALLGFVAVCVGLIGVIWAEGLVADQPATPSYYRESFDVDEGVYLTITARAAEYQQELEGTPSGTPIPETHQDGEHHGPGQGQGAGQGQGNGGGSGSGSGS